MVLRPYFPLLSIIFLDLIKQYAVCATGQSMEDLSVATVYFMIIDVIDGRMLRYYVIVSLNFTEYLMLCLVLRSAS